MVVVEIVGVVQIAPEEVTPPLGLPVVNTLPPLEPANQRMSSPAETVAFRLTVPVPHRVPAIGLVGVAGRALTVCNPLTADVMVPQMSLVTTT